MTRKLNITQKNAIPLAYFLEEGFTDKELRYMARQHKASIAKYKFFTALNIADKLSENGCAVTLTPLKKKTFS